MAGILWRVRFRALLSRPHGSAEDRLRTRRPDSVLDRLRRLWRR